MNEQFASMLERLAERLGVTAQSLWVTLVHQAPISAATSVLVIVILLGIGSALTRFGLRAIRSNSDDMEPVGVSALIIGCPIFIAGVIALCGCMHDIISGFFSPEYWALEEIMQTVRGCK